MKGTGGAGDSLDHEASVLIDQYRHGENDPLSPSYGAAIE
jgi:hypothetical protein